MRVDRRTCWLGVLLVLSGATHGLAFGAEPAQKSSPPVFEADVKLVAVPVFVTDKSGKAVSGLTAADFEVEDGGRRVPIVAFQAVDVDVPAAAGAQQPDLPVAVQAATPRQFLLLFDLLFSPPGAIARARTAAIRFVQDSLAPSDLVAVAKFDNGGLKMLTSFTSDHAFVARAIEVFGLVGSVGSDPLALGGEIGVPPGGSEGNAAIADRELAEQVARMEGAAQKLYQLTIVDFLTGMEQLAQILSPLRGRKQIVLLSSGFAESAWTGLPAGASAAEAFAKRGSASAATDLLALMKEVFRKAGQADVVIHSVSVAGLEGPVDVASRTGHAARGEGLGSLSALAVNTGGRFILPTNDFGRALREVDQISRHSYVIAFEPAEPAAKPGQPRSLKVRVRGAGLSVSHRAAYVLPAPSSDVGAVRLGAAEAIAKGLSGGPLSLHVVTLPYRDHEGKPSVHAVLHVDGPALTGAIRGDKLEVEVYGYSMAAGHVVDTLALKTALDLSKLGARVRGSGFRVLTAFAVPPGPVDVRFFVRAGASGVTGSIRRNVDVPAFAEGDSVLSAPMFTLPLSGSVVVPLRTHSRPQVEIPFHLGNEPFVPEASVALLSGRPRDVCVFVWRARHGSTDPLDVAGEIARTGEAPLPLRIEGRPRVVPDGDGFDRYVLTIVPPPAPPGDYALRLTFREPGTGRTTLSETSIVLEK